jgi:genetic interactor of prohibitins 3, mitochondrial
MHRALSARWITKAMRLGDLTPSTIVPVFLCPSVHTKILHDSRLGQHQTTPSAYQAQQRREFHAVAEAGSIVLTEIEKPTSSTRRLPINCSGCGAFSQTNDPRQFGFYDLRSRRIKSWLHPQRHDLSSPDADENRIVQGTLAALSEERLRELGLEAASLLPGMEVDAEQARSGTGIVFTASTFCPNVL